jgi:predicted nucleic acid-binding protein
MIKAVLDACVLYSGSLRDFLLHLARRRTFSPFWSLEIQNEWARGLLKKRSELTPEKQKRTCRRMNLHFPDSCVRGYESIISTLVLPDANDRHVLAVAIHAKAEYIITFNLKDFPKTVLQSYGVEALLPEEFVLRLI